MTAALITFLHANLGQLAALVGTMALLLIHLKNRELEKSHLELAEKVDDMATAKSEQDIQTLQTKVDSDDKARIALETKITSATGAPGSGPGAGG